MPTTERVIDSHLHLWDPRRLRYAWLDAEPRLQRRFGPADLDAGGVDVAGCVVVQADCRDEQAAAEVDLVTGYSGGPPVLGVVAHAPLEQGAAVGSRLAELAEDPRVVGVRRLLQDEPDGFALREDFVQGVRLLGAHGLPFDLCVRASQLPEIVRLVDRCPEVVFVLDHLGKPDLRTGAPGWSGPFVELAGRSQVRCKLSGLTSQADPENWTPAQVVPYLRRAVQEFGPDRCMVGSDWPVASLTVTYAGWVELVLQATAELSSAEREAVLVRTATTSYGLRSVGVPC